MAMAHLPRRQPLASMPGMAVAAAICLALAVTPARASLIELGAPAPDFTGKSLRGADVHLADTRGQVVILDIWATWCPPCKEELPFLMHLTGRHPQAPLQLIAVSIDDHPANIHRFFERLHTPPPTVITDTRKQVPPLYGIEAMPTTVLIDKGGLVRFVHSGFEAADRAAYAREVKLLLAEADPTVAGVTDPPAAQGAPEAPGAARHIADARHLPHAP